MHAIRTDALRKVYDLGFWRKRPYVALDGLTLEVEAGEVFGFLGPNGAGKTTTIGMVICFLPVGGGSLRIFGLDVRDSGRAINNGDANWPKTLDGFAKRAYDYWEQNLKQHGDCQDEPRPAQAVGQIDRLAGDEEGVGGGEGPVGVGDGGGDVSQDVVHGDDLGAVARREAQLAQRLAVPGGGDGHLLQAQLGAERDVLQERAAGDARGEAQRRLALGEDALVGAEGVGEVGQRRADFRDRMLPLR